jgi:hypothetical protein
VTGLDLSLGFMLGLVGSVHCVQMCGPIVLAYSLPLGGDWRGRQFLAHAAYNAGRILTYSALGAVAGALGGAAAAVVPIAGMFNTAALAAGVLMILGGIWMTGLVPIPRFLQSFAVPSARWTQATARFLRSPAPASKLAMGALLGFMPCGLIYAALLKAVETGAALNGALTMAAFGVGTAGALVVTGVFSGAIGGWLRRAGTWLPAAGVILLGAFLVWRGVMNVSPQSCPVHKGMIIVR